MKIFLIGYMGSGKSTLGKALATILSVPFIDMDNAIELMSGQSISEIFEKHGEAYFRNLESKALKDMEGVEAAIVACGGGTPCFNDNLEWMNKEGLTIYLKLSPQSIVQRLKNKRDERPLIKNKSEKELHDFIEQHLNSRTVFYEQAQLIYSTDELSLEESLIDLERFLKRFG